MRDLLTALAGLLVLVLVAALAVPPLIDWRNHRALLDGALAHALGSPVVSDGALDIRLLPSPRVRIEHLTLGATTPDAASLDARFVRAEIAPASLLSGEIRFLDSRVGRMEIKLPAGADGHWRVPARLAAAGNAERRLIVDELAVSQLLVTTVEPSTGRTDQVYTEGVRIVAQSLLGPWRVEGAIGAVPFTLAAGALLPPPATGANAGPPSDLVTPIKLATRGEGMPSLDLDAKVTLTPGPEGDLVPALAGTAKLAAPAPRGKPDAAPPWSAAAAVKAAGTQVDLAGVTIEGSGGAGSLRLEGDGRFDLAGRRLSVALAGRRLDLDGLAPGGLFAAALPAPPIPGLTLDLALRLDSVSSGGEDWSGVSLAGSLAGGVATIDRFDATLPGATRVTGSGEIAPGPTGRVGGRLSVVSKASDRLAAYLRRAGFGQAPLDLLDGRPLEASGDILLAPPVTSVRNLRILLGDAQASGTVRYNAAAEGQRARFDAQLSVQGLDVTNAAPPPFLVGAAQDVDLGLTLDARDVGYGGGRKGGRIAARITSQGPALAVERLEITDLAGANATLSGRIAPDGTGRIAGRVVATRAAPILALVGRFWVGGLADLVPPVLADKPLDLTVSSERAGGAGSVLRTRLAGQAAGGALEAEVGSLGARAQTLDATLTSAQAGAWLGLSGPDRSARLVLSGRRTDAGRLAASLSGELGGLRVATPQPFTVAADEDGLDAGTVSLAADDAGPLLAGLAAPVATPVPLALTVALARVAGVPNLRVAGKVAGAALDADLFGHSAGELGGSVTLDRLSLPWLLNTLAFRPPPPAGNAPAAQPASAGTGPAWPSARFGPARAPALGGAVTVAAKALDLGAGLGASDARFDLSAGPDGVSLRNFQAALGGGQVGGSLSVTRQEGLAAVIGELSTARVALSTFAGPPFADGRITASLRIGGSGESVTSILTNLGGAGTVQIDDLVVAGADGGAVERIAGRALRSDDPLALPRLAALATEELGRGSLAVSSLSGNASVIGGAVRVTPLVGEAAAATWQGSASVDLRGATLDVRGNLTARNLPRNWTGPPPYLGLGWTGPVAKPVRTVDVGVLANGLASVVLGRELDRIDTFDLDAAERARLNARIDMDKARRAAADEAIRQARLRDEAERIRADAEQRAAEQRAKAAASGNLGPDAVPAPLPAPPGRPSGAATGG